MRSVAIRHAKTGWAFLRNAHAEHHIDHDKERVNRFAIYRYQVVGAVITSHELGQFQLEYLEAVRVGFTSSVPDGVKEAAVSYADTLMGRGFPVLFDQQHLAHVTGVASNVIGTLRSDPARFYSSFRIAKRGTGSRVIHAPSPALKRVQHWLQRHVTSWFLSHPSAHGFVPGRSIVTNATPHAGAKTVLKLDIRDFFGSVNRASTYRAFRFAGYSKRVSDLLAQLTTVNDALPQGAPTSPDLSNFAAYRLDVRLSAFAEKHELTYTRYADDLSFGGVIDPREQRTIELIMRREGFAPNERKLRYLRSSERQSITGIVVNEKVNWPRDRRRWLRQEVYYVEKFGLDAHLARRGVQHGEYKEYLYGHLYALHAVRPDEARALLTRLDGVEWPY